MNLGILIADAVALDPTLLVRFADGRATGRLMSYRGYYDHLAFEPGLDPTVRRDSFTKSASKTPRAKGSPVVLYSIDFGPYLTVGTLVKGLRAALDSTFFGYKGGEFTMTDTTPLHVAHYGDTSDEQVADITVIDGVAVIGVEDES